MGIHAVLHTADISCIFKCIFLHERMINRRHIYNDIFGYIRMGFD